MTIVYTFVSGRLLLLRYLKVYDFDHEQARRLLLLNFNLRKRNPHIFMDRDFRGEKVQNALSVL